MLRSSSRILNNVVTVGSLELDYNIQNSVLQQFVRWRIRKPVHLGTAKSKIFRVPTRPVLSEPEKEELKYLFYHYRTLIGSQYAYMKEENMKLADGSKQLQEEQEKEDAEFLLCLDENDRWNKECEKVRNARLAEEKLQREMIALQRQRRLNIVAEQKMLEWEEKVNKEIEASKTFISEEMLDEAIRRAIENPVDFNFAITSKGEVIKGSDPIHIQSKSSENVQATG